MPYVPLGFEPDEHRPHGGRQLLCHSSGIKAWPNPYDHGRLISRPSTHAALARQVAQNALLSTPGKFSYTDTNYDVICAIVEQITPRFQTFIQSRLFEPLGMSSVFPIFKEGICIFCGGGLRASLADVAALYQTHLNKGTHNGVRILSSESINEMHKKQAEGELSVLGEGIFEYGLGFFRDRVLANGEARTIYHYGHFGTLAWIDFDYDLVGVVFLDTQKVGWRPAAKKIQSLVREAVHP